MCWHCDTSSKLYQKKKKNCVTPHFWFFGHCFPLPPHSEFVYPSLSLPPSNFLSPCSPPHLRKYWDNSEIFKIFVCGGLNFMHFFNLRLRRAKISVSNFCICTIQGTKITSFCSYICIYVYFLINRAPDKSRYFFCSVQIWINPSVRIVEVVVDLCTHILYVIIFDIIYRVLKTSYTLLVWAILDTSDSYSDYYIQGVNLFINIF